MFNLALLNLGGHYDVTSGIYTVPLDGVYEFMNHMWAIEDAFIGAYIKVDSVTV